MSWSRLQRMYISKGTESKQQATSFEPPTFVLIEDNFELADLANGDWLNININTMNLLMGCYLEKLVHVLSDFD